MTDITNDPYIPEDYTGPIKVVFNPHGWDMWCDRLNRIIPAGSGIQVTVDLANQIDNGTGVLQFLDA